MQRAMPRWLRLSKRYIRRVEKLLTALPHTVPEIRINPDDIEPSTIDWQEARECFAPLVVGAEGLVAVYDGRSGEFTAGYCHRVSRCVKARGIWCHELCETGCEQEGKAFHLNLHESRYYRVGRDHTYELGDFFTGPRFPRRLEITGVVKQIDSNAFRGPQELRAVGVERALVRVGDLPAQKCMRIMTLTTLHEEPDEEATVGSQAPIWLDDAYINAGGRTLLQRRLHSQHHHDELARGRDIIFGGENDWPAGRARLQYNGVDFYHWHDTVTEAAFCTHWQHHSAAQPHI